MQQKKNKLVMQCKIYFALIKEYSSDFQLLCGHKNDKYQKADHKLNTALMTNYSICGTYNFPYHK